MWQSIDFLVTGVEICDLLHNLAHSYALETSRPYMQIVARPRTNRSALILQDLTIGFHVLPPVKTFLQFWISLSSKDLSNYCVQQCHDAREWTDNVTQQDEALRGQEFGQL